MSLGTLDRIPPPLFKQGPSALSRLMVFSALALFLMVADTRLNLTQPIRLVLGGFLYPLQALAVQPLALVRSVGVHFQSLHDAQAGEAVARDRALLLSQRAGQVEELAQENHRLRQLLALRQRLNVTAQAAEVLYDAADPFTRKVFIDKGLAQGVEAGSPVLDEDGVLGQVTRVYPLISEVTLVNDRDQAIPVLNVRTGARGVAYGDPNPGGGLELRFMGTHADVQAGDLLTTSGVDGVYPPGLPVARVDKVERRADSAFARILCTPQARVDGVRQVMVLKPLTAHIPPRPPAEAPAPAAGGKKGGR